LQRDTVVNPNGDKTETEYQQDGKTPVKSTETTIQGQVSTVNYDEEGKPQSKQVKLGSTTSNYTYDAEGNEVLGSKIENEGLAAKERRTEYQYNEDGTVTENVTEHNSTSVTTRNEQGKALSQTKTVDGQEYTVEYDGEGNTKGVIVQNGESPASIAKKFGVSVDNLTRVNQDVLQGKKYFNVGDSIKIPKEVQADDTALQGRKTAEETQADYAQDAQVRQQQHELKVQQQRARQQAVNKSLGIVNTENAGQKRVGYTGQANLGTRKKSNLTYTVLGQTFNREREVVKGSDGKIYTMAKDGTILKEEYVKTTNLYDSGPKVKGQVKVKGKNGQWVTQTNNYVVVGNLSHGRKSVVDEKGQVHVMSQDGKILSAEYLQNSAASDVIRSDKNVAQTETINMLESDYKNAKAAFDAQMDKDGWAADVADGVSNVWGVFQKDGNQAWRVRRDLETYEQNLTSLKQAAKQGEAQFNAKFKQIYGKDYDRNAVAQYRLHPTEANYQNAFGTKNDIAARVAKYNASQDTGATVVKTTAVVGAGIALNAIPVVGQAASASLWTAAAVAGGTTAAASFFVNSTDSVSSHNGQKKLQNGDFSDIGQAAVNAMEDGTLAAVGGGVGKAVKGLSVVGGTTKAARAVNATARAGIGIGADVTAGAAREYIDTGEVTVEGTLTNATVAATGQIIGSGVAANVGRKARNALNSGFRKAEEAIHSGTPSSSSVHVNTNAESSLGAQPKAASGAANTTAAGGAAHTTSPKTNGNMTSQFDLNQPFDKALNSVNNIKSQAELSEAFGKLQTNNSLTTGQKQAMSRALVERRKALNNPEAANSSGKPEVQDAVHSTGQKLESGQHYQIADNAKLKLGYSCEVDLRDPQIRAKLDNLKPGETLTIGRDPNADIVIGDNHMDVSRQQALIGKDADGNLILQDTSANGTTLASGVLRQLSTFKGDALKEEGKNLVQQEMKDETNNNDDGNPHTV